MITLLLVGKVGCGKSSTGNSILMKQQFLSSLSSASTTNNVEYDCAVINGMELKVLDSPGLQASESTAEQSKQFLTNAFLEAVKTSPDGLDALIYVCKFGRFTKEDMEVRDAIIEVFGSDFLKRHCIIIMSNADQYDEEDEDDKNIHQWIIEQTGLFSELRKECGNRIVPFDNETDDVLKKEQQTIQLLQFVEKLVKQNGRYTKEKFDQERETKRKFDEILKVQSRSEQFIKNIGFILHEVSNLGLEVDNAEAALQQLEATLNKAKQLKETISGIKAPSKREIMLDQCSSVIKIIKVLKTAVNRMHEQDRIKRSMQSSLEYERENFEFKIKQLSEENKKLEREKQEMLKHLKKSIQLSKTNILFFILIMGAGFYFFKTICC